MQSLLYRVTEWIAKFALVNLLWIAFTMVGFVIFGLFPATVAMFVLIRHWLRGNTDKPIFHTFWQTYKKEFLKANLLGMAFVIIGIILSVNVQYILLIDGLLVEIMRIPLYLFMLVILLTLLYVIPTYVHYDIRLSKVWKNSLLIMLMHPIQTLIMGISVYAVLFMLWYFPGLMFFFGGSLVAFINMGICYHVFHKIETKQKSLNLVV